MHFTDAQLIGWLQQFIWPLARIGSALMIAPVLGSGRVSPRIRMTLAMLTTLLIAPSLPPPPVAELFASIWWATLLREMAIGLLIGFTLQIVFEAVMFGGELISASSSLSFATLADPLRGMSTPVVGQFLTLTATLLFLALGGHLQFLQWLARSFGSLPVGGTGPEQAQLLQLLRFGGEIFSGGLMLALPVLVALLAINLALGVISRSAPSLNLFAVGFPLGLIACLVLLYVAMPAMLEKIGGLFDQGWLALASWTQ
ncbi:flagellar biosynthetic protein FliR [Solimonas terrae]|uniref:Flagellar biosynthetic protein FliR n=1 Tax=Solimonas terrae TaxID=1396819 RepID=A0A6M2BX86_9GAMM|nr:flagellar biosynthetic protein FliR [Solimonas terrae]NGY06905.1 flagellar biosynthetic protein FliR [Solimonas terrae]